MLNPVWRPAETFERQFDLLVFSPNSCSGAGIEGKPCATSMILKGRSASPSPIILQNSLEDVFEKVPNYGICPHGLVMSQFQ